MTSTGIYQGMDVGSKTSSRVSNPPGGRSNNIFGTTEEKPAAARQKPAQSSNAQIGAPAQSAKPKNINTRSNIFGFEEPEPSSSQRTARRFYRLRDSSSFSTLGFGTGDSAADLAAQRSANQKRNQASTFMFGGEDNSACVPQQKVNPPANVPVPSSTVESPASNCNQVNPITNQVSSPAASNSESPSRVSRVNVQKKTPEHLPAAGAKVNAAWETSHRQRSNPPGGKSSITF